jgi:putative toxin-antitoxin system antitoxin component (TIGR02293 family)
MSRNTVTIPLHEGTGRIVHTQAARDARLLGLFESKSLHRALRRSTKLNLQSVAALAVEELEAPPPKPTKSSLRSDPVAIHGRLVEGLPGLALFVSSALAFESLQEALPYFDVSAKTAWEKLDATLNPSQSEQALRLARVATQAAELFGSAEAGRKYLRTPNFALGGATPLDLLRTGQGEQLVLAELQSQAAGGPV